MATIEQMNANRENAKRSTGPSSPSGKKASRMNALKHGFAGQTIIIPDHELEVYERHFAAFRSEHRPVGPTEEFMVQSLAEYSWAIQQIRSLLTNRTYLAGASPVRGIEDTHGPEIDNAMAQACNVIQLADAFNKFGLYEQRKARLFDSTLKRLQEQQATRKAKEKAELELAAALRKDDLANRQPSEPEWHPTQNGFVCSMEAIDQFLSLQKRLDRINSPKRMAA